MGHGGVAEKRDNRFCRSTAEAVCVIITEENDEGRDTYGINGLFSRANSR